VLFSQRGLSVDDWGIEKENGTTTLVVSLMRAANGRLFLDAINGM
jgi:hypothetical protein